MGLHDLKAGTHRERYNRTMNEFNLGRFLHAQEGSYNRALGELRRGEKRSHWMWYIFPQIDGLGYSATTKYYAIKSKEEALAYISHSVLGARLLECARAVRDIQGRTAAEIFGFPDDVKLRSSMTLFSYVSEQDSVFQLVLDKYFDGQGDEKTLEVLK